MINWLFYCAVLSVNFNPRNKESGYVCSTSFLVAFLVDFHASVAIAKKFRSHREVRKMRNWCGATRKISKEWHIRVELLTFVVPLSVPAFRLGSSEKVERAKAAVAFAKAAVAFAQARTIVKKSRSQFHVWQLQQSRHRGNVIYSGSSCFTSWFNMVR